MGLITSHLEQLVRLLVTNLSLPAHPKKNASVINIFWMMANSPKKHRFLRVCMRACVCVSECVSVRSCVCP